MKLAAPSRLCSIDVSSKVRQNQKGAPPVATLTQPSLFSWEIVDRSPEILRLERVLAVLPDGELLDALVAERAGKRNDYPIVAVWNSLIAGIVFGHDSVASLIRELRRNAELRLICGFDPLGGEEVVPNAWQYSKFFKKLFANAELVDAMFERLVERVRELLPDFGAHLAIDGKALPAYGRKDADADWGSKTYRGVKEDGTPYKKVKSWFGYKLHLIVDVDYELPIGYEVTKASEADVNRMMPMIESLGDEHPELYERAESLSADRNNLADQAFNDFSAFPEDAIVRIAPDEIRKKGRVPKNSSVFFTIFQTFMTGTDEKGEPSPYFGDYPPDFFDFIVIDECHRGGARDESNWRGILEYFSPAAQLGLTATPKRRDNVDTYAYFGEPVYIYSLKEGINDGYTHFNDPEWDGEPIDPEVCEKCGCFPCRCEKPDPEPCPECGKWPCECEQEPCEECGQAPCVCRRRRKVKVKLADGKEREIQHMMATSFWGPDGKPMSAAQFVEKLFGDLPAFFKDEDELRRIWGRPDTRKYLSVVGHVKNPVTIQAAIGTPFRDCIAMAGGAKTKEFGLLSGGVMMGRLETSLDAPVTRTTGALLVFPDDHPLLKVYRRDTKARDRIGRSACDQCSYCTEYCPRYLLGHPIEPHKAMRSLGMVHDRRPTIVGGAYCCECNICSLWACPEGLDPRDACVKAKAEARENNVKWQGEPRPVHPVIKGRQVPVKRLMTRLKLDGFKNTGPLIDATPQSPRLTIPMRQHVGAPCEPTVSVGETVKEGDVIGQPPQGALGVPIHASADGRVVEVGDGCVVIARG